MLSNGNLIGQRDLGNGIHEAHWRDPFPKPSYLFALVAADLEKIDYSRPVTLFSQTTKSTKGFYALSEKIEEKIKSTKGELTEIDFNSNDSICRQVSNREPQLQRFSQENEVILFVSGKKSSNGMALYQVCLSENPRSYFIESEEEIELAWFQNAERVGICGATSTPMWLMEQVKAYVDGIEEHLLQD